MPRAVQGELKAFAQPRTTRLEAPDLIVEQVSPARIVVASGLVLLHQIGRGPVGLHQRFGAVQGAQAVALPLHAGLGAGGQQADIGAGAGRVAALPVVAILAHRHLVVGLEGFEGGVAPLRLAIRCRVVHRQQAPGVPRQGECQAQQKRERIFLQCDHD